MSEGEKKKKFYNICSTFSKIVIGVITALIVVFVSQKIYLSEPYIVQIKEQGPPSKVKVEGIEMENKNFLIHFAVENKFKNKGFKSGFIDKIKVHPSALLEQPEIEIVNIDKSPIKWREEKIVKCNFVAKIKRKKFKLSEVSEYENLYIAEVRFNSRYHDNTGAFVTQHEVKFYVSVRPVFKDGATSFQIEESTFNY